MFTQRISAHIWANCSGGKETDHAIILRLANTARVCQGKDVDGSQVWELWVFALYSHLKKQWNSNSKNLEINAYRKHSNYRKLK